MPTWRSGLNGSKRAGSLLSSGPELSTRSGTVHNANARNAVPRDETSDSCGCHAQRYGAHRLHDSMSLLGISCRPDAVLDPGTPNGFAVGTLELHGESLVDTPNLGRRVDRSRVVGNDRRRQGWMSCSELNCDHGSEAVADYDRPRDPISAQSQARSSARLGRSYPSSSRSLLPHPRRSNVVTA